MRLPPQETPTPASPQRAAARAVAAGLALAAASFSYAASPGLALSPVADSSSAGLGLRSEAFPDDLVEFRSCEAVLSGDRDFGLFKIALAAADSLEQPRWRRDGRAWSYRWRYDAGIVVGFRAEPAADCVVLRYEVENRTGAPLPRVLVHPCIVTTRAPSFFAPAVGAGDDPSPSKRSAPHAELFGRVWLWRCGERFAFADLDLTPEEPHTAVMRAGEPPVAWAWWVNSSAVFDESLIVLEASHASGSLGIWFEEAVWASVNAGDERACVHLFPSFGDLAPGERGVVHGRLLISELGVDATRRWLLDQRRAAPLQ